MGLFVFKEVIMDTKAMGLLAQLTKGLLIHSKRETETQLGDRSQYIGMSDIGKGAECMRAAVANKVYGSNQPSPDDILKWHRDSNYDKIRAALNKELILQRGHWLEGGILSAFEANNTNIIPQLEIATNLPRHQQSENDATCGRPVAAHLDFTLV
jgi:hypothetical protein